MLSDAEIERKDFCHIEPPGCVHDKGLPIQKANQLVQTIQSALHASKN